jgi:hypothetical protein
VIFKKLTILVLSTIVLSACGNGEGGRSNLDDSSDAQYQVRFVSVWDDIDFPTQFPSNAHFSGLVGATHSEIISFWSPGDLASSGIKQVAETGRKTLFLSEINTAFNNGDVDLILNGGSIGTSPGNVSYEFSINRSHSLVTLVSMVAPSPDWFVGVHGLDLFDPNQDDWVSSFTIELEVYDAGTDSGLTFRSANNQTEPREIVALLSSQTSDTDFIKGLQSGTLQAIGSFIFTRIK